MSGDDDPDEDAQPDEGRPDSHYDRVTNCESTKAAAFGLLDYHAVFRKRG